MLYNDPKSFREDMLQGYVAAFEEYIVEVPGGVARATETPEGKVAVINGGGSGHYPAFCGIIGSGFMDATVVGNVFTSPSTDDVYHVAKAVENGSGVFIIGGNYAGDKMNFDMARDRLKSEGIDARTFYITDDIASASPDEWEKRRGNVGTFSVFKAAGAASDAGYDFDEIVRLTSKANDHTRTISVGFKGCTLPGAAGPMFHVPKGKMEVGQGIHGEAGVYESDLVSAAELGELLTEKILSEAGMNKELAKCRRLGVILDGLGSTKYEELFVLWKTVSAVLKEKGYTLVAPLVGEFVTSLDMAGVALSIQFLDEELEALWMAPADTPSFKRGTAAVQKGRRRVVYEAEEKRSYQRGTENSRKAGLFAAEGFARMQKAIQNMEGTLARIDSIAGDGDHGRGMVKGVTYACEAAGEAAKAGAGIGTVLNAAGDAWASKAGGTSGILWGAALQALGKVLGDDQTECMPEKVVQGVCAAAQKIQDIGGAHVGDKTMLDALIPFCKELDLNVKSGMMLETAWKKAAETAWTAAMDTAQMIPKVGRARPQAERSFGTPDAGAVSMALCLRVIYI